MFTNLTALSLSPAATEPAATSAIKSTWDFFMVGGPFMAVIVLCSFVALAVIVFKILTLKKDRVVPDKLAGEVERLEDYLGGGSLGELQKEFSGGHTTLARLCAVAMRRRSQPRAEVQLAVQSSAREEIVKLNAGLPILEVIVNVAPLLGLLGTASGLFIVFRDLGVSANHSEIARGISMALSTTIVGLAVAVPAMIAHSHFSRKIEMMAARLEVLLGHVLSATHPPGTRGEETP